MATGVSRHHSTDLGFESLYGVWSPFISSPIASTQAPKEHKSLTPYASNSNSILWEEPPRTWLMTRRHDRLDDWLDSVQLASQAWLLITCARTTYLAAFILHERLFVSGCLMHTQPHSCEKLLTNAHMCDCLPMLSVACCTHTRTSIPRTNTLMPYPNYPNPRMGRSESLMTTIKWVQPHTIGL